MRNQMNEMNQIQRVHENQGVYENQGVNENQRVQHLQQFKGRLSDCYLTKTMEVSEFLRSDRGDVPGWVLVVLMTTGLVTGIWTLAAPRIDSILRNSLDSMNGIR